MKEPIENCARARDPAYADGTRPTPMTYTPTPDQVRARVATLDDRQRKIVGGLIAVLFQNANRASDNEWVCEQLVHVTLLAGGFDEANSGPEVVQLVQEYLGEHADLMLSATFAIFARTAQDLASRDDGFTLEDAMQQGLSYF